MFARIRALLVLFALTAVLLVTSTVPSHAASSYFCSGYAGCLAKGYSESGYAAANKAMYWRMTKGHNCTNYVAYRMVQNGMPATRPWTGTGNAYNWGPANPARTDRTPTVGAVAWWKAGVKGAGKLGHVAYVEKVVSIDEIIISEDSWGGTFHWRRVQRASGWPSGFVHFKDAGVGSPRGSLNLAYSPGSHQLRLRGWSYDPSAPTKPVKIVAYVGGRPGIGRKVTLGTADDSRPDVAKVYPKAGANHGFDRTVSISRTGQLPVYVYGLDLANTSGTSALLGLANVSVPY